MDHDEDSHEGAKLEWCAPVLLLIGKLDDVGGAGCLNFDEGSIVADLDSGCS